MVPEFESDNSIAPMTDFVWPGAEYIFCKWGTKSETAEFASQRASVFKSSLNTNYFSGVADSFCHESGICHVSISYNLGLGAGNQWEDITKAVTYSYIEVGRRVQYIPGRTKGITMSTYRPPSQHSGQASHSVLRTSLFLRGVYHEYEYQEYLLTRYLVIYTWPYRETKVPRSF